VNLAMDCPPACYSLNRACMATPFRAHLRRDEFSSPKSSLLAGFEAYAMIRKGQVRKIDGRDIRAQAIFIAGIFDRAA